METTLLKARDYIRENDKETITLMDSIQHLYLLMKEKNHEKVELKQYDISGQLNYIREELEVVEDVIRNVRINSAKHSNLKS